jgi:hypothetical protein
LNLSEISNPKAFSPTGSNSKPTTPCSILYVYDDNIIRFRYTNQKEFSAAPSYAVISELPAKSAFTFKDDGRYFTLTTKTLSVRITKSPCRVTIYDQPAT